MAETMTPAEVALLDGGHDGMFSGGGAFFWIFALLILAGGNFGFGNNRGDYVTSSELSSQLGAQAIQGQLQQIAVETANNNYETAQLINNQTNQMLQQNSTNLINAIQGFNTLGQKIDQLGYHMDQCCCEIKTQMLLLLPHRIIFPIITRVSIFLVSLVDLSLGLLAALRRLLVPNLLLGGGVFGPLL